MSKPPQRSDLVSDLKPVLYIFGGGSLIFSLILLFFPLNYEYISNKKREDEKIEKDNQSIFEIFSLLFVPRKSLWAPQLVLYLMIAGQIWLFYNHVPFANPNACLLYTSDAADE